MPKKTKPQPRRKNSAKNNQPPASQLTIYKGIAWTLLACVWVLVVVALGTYDPKDAPSSVYGVTNVHVQNWVGSFGAVISAHAYTMLGPGIWVLMAGVAVYLIKAAARRQTSQIILRVVGLLLMMVTVSALYAVAANSVATSSEAINPHSMVGGMLAVYINDNLLPRFAVFGTTLILLAFFCVGAVLTADRWVLALPKLLGHVFRKASNTAASIPKYEGPGLGARLGAFFALLIPKRLRAGQELRENDLDDYDQQTAPIKSTRRDTSVDDEEGEEAGELKGGHDSEDEIDEQEEAGDAPGAYVVGHKQFDPDALREKMAQLPVNFAPQNQKAAAPPPREIDMSGYQFPGMDILEEPESNFTVEQEQIVRDQAVQLESALQQYKISGEVVGIDSGPVITLFDVRLAPGTKVSALSKVDSDLARALKVQNIRVVANMEGKDTVGVEVPNLNKERVRLKELMTVGRETMTKMKLPMYLGKDASGSPLIQDLAKMPHMLIAGTTGSGKSVCMNSIIMSFLFTKRPDEMKMVLVDPKMVEMSMFKNIPHLMCPVVTEMDKATAILEWAVTKMDERYELLAEAGVRDIGSYNKLEWEEIKERIEPASEEEEARIPKKLPYLVFVIDELADLMMTNKEVEGSIVRIAQKARAVGIHLILATQRPQANVVTGLIKSNMPSRIAFKVSSGMDSRIVLDQKGGELLLGQGDMLFLSPSSSKLTRAQGTLVDDIEIRQTVKFLKEVSEQNFEPQLVQIKSGSGDSENTNGMGKDPVLEAQRDPLFDDAVEVIIESGRGSVSLLQRRLTIGYGRASRLIEAMGDSGIIGAYKGTQSREVNISLDEWEAMKAQAAVDAQQGGVGETQDDAYDAVDAYTANEHEDAGVPDELEDEFKR